MAERIAASLRAGRRAGDHAILVRANRDADPFLALAEHARVPWRFAGTAGLYHQPEVRLLVSFLRAVNDPEDSVSCYDLATSSIFGLGPERRDAGVERGVDAAARASRWHSARPSREARRGRPSAAGRSRSWSACSAASTSIAP